MKIRYLVPLLISFLIVSCGDTKRSADMRFVPIDILTQTSIKEYGSKTIRERLEKFIVIDYVFDDSTEFFLDQFFCKKINENKDYFNIYATTFYKESSKTNLTSIVQYPEIIDHYSGVHDDVANYMWKRNVKSHKRIYKKQNWFQRWYCPQKELVRLKDVVCD